MFINAVERVATFTRPIHIIFRTYGSEDVRRAAATLFFVNSDGWALTCKHVSPCSMRWRQSNLGCHW